MPEKLSKQIGKTKPFASVEQEAFLNLQRTADVLMSGMAAVLKASDLSPTQYNVLRILRGAGEAGLPCGEVGERMITRDPDMTRLLDRLEKRDLITRHRGDSDRRIVRARITPKGLDLLGELDESVRDAHRRQLGHLGRGKLKQLIALLEDVRAANQ